MVSKLFVGNGLSQRQEIDTTFIKSSGYDFITNLLSAEFHSNLDGALPFIGSCAYKRFSESAVALQALIRQLAHFLLKEFRVLTKAPGQFKQKFMAGMFPPRQQIHCGATHI